MEDKISLGEMVLFISTALAIFIFAMIIIKIEKIEDKKYSREGYEIKTYHEEDYTYYIYEDKIGDVVKVEIK